MKSSKPNGQHVGAILKKLINLPDDLSGCWEWAGFVSPKTGYGKKQFDGKTLLAHRWVYQIFNGHIQEGKVIDHLCGNRKCVNPNHLEVVSQTENCRRGNGTKLSPLQASAIKSALLNKPNNSQQKLAARYGVSGVLITDIKNGKAWSDINPQLTTQRARA